MFSNPALRRREKYLLFSIFLLAYAILFAYNISTGSKWWLDALFAIAFLIIVTLVNRWLKLGRLGFILFNLAFVLHNMGSFGWYDCSIGGIGYDNFVHFVGSFVAAFIIFNFIARKLHIRKKERRKDTVIDEHIAVMIFLVMASAAALGVLVEVVEFGGFVFLGQGEGIFFTGQGDEDSYAGLDGNYVDTMTDVVVNLLGSLTGTLTYFLFTYQKRPWLHQ